jgi:hypothetical protein
MKIFQLAWGRVTFLGPESRAQVGGARRRGVGPDPGEAVGTHEIAAGGLNSNLDKTLVLAPGEKEA